MLCGEELQIPQGMDVFNSCKLHFRNLAVNCTMCVKAESAMHINNLNTYTQFFPNLYRHYLDLIISNWTCPFSCRYIWRGLPQSCSWMRNYQRGCIVHDNLFPLRLDCSVDILYSLFCCNTLKMGSSFTCHGDRYHLPPKGHSIPLVEGAFFIRS